MQSLTPPLFANENVPAPLVRMLRSEGAVVQSVTETMPAASDLHVLQHAVAANLWILTFDRDYGELVFSRKMSPPPAIIFLRQAPLSWAEYAERVIGLLANPAEVIGHLAVVEYNRVRLRPLTRP